MRDLFVADVEPFNNKDNRLADILHVRGNAFERAVDADEFESVIERNGIHLHAGDGGGQSIVHLLGNKVALLHQMARGLRPC